MSKLIFLILILIFNFTNNIHAECVFRNDYWGKPYCVRCADGTECPSGRTCPPGTYSLYGQSCNECISGLYSSQAGSSQCTICPAGYYCDDKITPKLCPAGTFSPSSSTKCTDCGRGYYSSAGKKFVSFFQFFNVKSINLFQPIF